VRHPLRIAPAARRRSARAEPSTVPTSRPPPPDLPESARWLPQGTFRERSAVVTGGGTGLGLEISRGLAALGAEVTILSRSPAHHERLLAEAGARGWRVFAERADVRAPAEVARAAAAVLARSGKVDLLVNNAAGNFVCPSERLSANAWRAVLGIVLDGTFYCSRDFGRSMLERKSGQILNVVATYAWTGMPGVAHSASAKAGVLALTKTLAAEWASHGVRVNAIAPGPFHSEGASANLWPDAAGKQRLERQIPLGRFGTAAEVAAHCLYLLSPQCAWVTGECLVVDGGISLARSIWQPGERVAHRAREEDP
jgi:NAD(P)-dependent dehydrogenase (short-subunit alcohol dehydrogenase family)